MKTENRHAAINLSHHFISFVGAERRRRQFVGAGSAGASGRDGLA